MKKIFFGILGLAVGAFSVANVSSFMVFAEEADENASENVNVTAEMTAGVSAETEMAVRGNCATIKDNLRAVQYADARMREALGMYYETAQTKFVTPLNMRLVENNLSNTNFINNQNSFVNTRKNFTIDFTEYQKNLEELIIIDCKTEPLKFLSKLSKVRGWREIVSEDTAKMSKLLKTQVMLVKNLKGEL